MRDVPYIAACFPHTDICRTNERLSLAFFAEALDVFGAFLEGGDVAALN
jgi:hypothetical protein